ncbi:hypothetical protein FPV67DRAFT_1131430 [Lyophyllum atratum]|nr:hypothetical protein FPV67DRAFT_1131430 [Lyophyllum atratum]
MVSFLIHLQIDAGGRQAYRVVFTLDAAIRCLWRLGCLRGRDCLYTRLLRVPLVVVRVKRSWLLCQCQFCINPSLSLPSVHSFSGSTCGRFISTSCRACSSSRGSHVSLAMSADAWCFHENKVDEICLHQVAILARHVPYTIDSNNNGMRGEHGTHGKCDLLSFSTTGIRLLRSRVLPMFITINAHDHDIDETVIRHSASTCQRHHHPRFNVNVVLLFSTTSSIRDGLINSQALIRVAARNGWQAAGAYEPW